MTASGSYVVFTVSILLVSCSPMFAGNWPSRYARWDWHFIAALIVLLDLFILSSLFGSLDVCCWDVHSFCLSPEIHKKKYSGWGSCLTRNFGRQSSYCLRELLIIKQAKTENELTPASPNHRVSCARSH
jgi:hypothetical protein